MTSNEGRLSPRVDAMLDAQADVIKRLKKFMGDEVRRGKKQRDVANTFDDRRDMYWRLADASQSLIYGRTEDCVTDAPTEDTFVDDVYFVYRPDGEDHVMVVVHTGLTDYDVVAVLRSSMERP